MALGSWYLTQSVTHTKKRPADPPQTDDYGNDVYVTTTGLLHNCLVEPRITTGIEETTFQQHSEDGLDLYCADPGADIAETDQFVVDGEVWEVSKPVHRWRGSRTGTTDYCSTVLRRVTG